ncbi:MAG: DUF4230 domain-containing protein [Verrucomicrobiota bacterium]|jgi:hypothetical protein
MLKKAAAAIGALAIIFALGLVLGLFSYRWLAPRFGGLLNTATLIKKVQTLSQFVTVKYSLEKIIVYDDPKWYGDSRVLLVAHGVVKAGIDLDQIAPKDIDVSGKKISVALPRPRVTDVYLDDRRTQIVERSTGLLRVFDKDLEQNARRQAVEELRLAALQNGILNDATAQARSQLTSLFNQVGFTEVVLRSK